MKCDGGVRVGTVTFVSGSVPGLAKLASAEGLGGEDSYRFRLPWYVKSTFRPQGQKTWPSRRRPVADLMPTHRAPGVLG